MILFPILGVSHHAFSKELKRLFMCLHVWPRSCSQESSSRFWEFFLAFEDWALRISYRLWKSLFPINTQRYIKELHISHLPLLSINSSYLYYIFKKSIFLCIYLFPYKRRASVYDNNIIWACLCYLVGHTRKM